MREVDLIGRIETPITLNARMNANAVTTTNYNELGNKPKINGVTLYGDLTPEELGIFYGAPFVANTVAEMTNTDKVYVYTGSETGYVAGNWYYYNGSEWVSGGVYNSAAVQTDRTLTQEDKAADAKVVGDALAMKAGIIEDTVTGEIVSFVPDKTIDKLLDASLEMSPIQSLNGYDSPWPGGGGKNKLDTAGRTITTNSGQEDFTHIYCESCTATKNGDTVTATITGAWSKLRFKIDTSKLTNGQTYTISALLTNPDAQTVSVGYNDGSWHTAVTSTSQSVRPSITFTYNSSWSRLVIVVLINNTSQNTGKTVTAKEIQLEQGSSVTAFSPYSNICPISGHTGAELYVAAEYDAEDKTTYSVTFTDQGTVYGGTYDFVTGKLTVTWTAQDMGTMNWKASSTPHCFYSAYFPQNYAVGASTRMLCSAYRFDGLKNSAPYYGDNGTFRGYLRTQTSNPNEVYFHDENYSDAASFKTAVSGQYIAYELVTPLEYTLSAQQLTTLQGQNVVWGNGTATAKYAADAKTYIDNKIAAAVAALS